MHNTYIIFFFLEFFNSHTPTTLCLLHRCHSLYTPSVRRPCYMTSFPTITCELCSPYIIPTSCIHTVLVFVHIRDISFVGCCVVQSVDFVCVPLLIWLLVLL